MQAVLVHPKNEKQITALKAVLEALEMPYEMGAFNKSPESPYNPEFVAQILKSSTNAQPGTGLKIDLENLWK